MGQWCPEFLGECLMCDVHICEKLARKIAEAGPEIAAAVLPTHYLLHILECEVCIEKIRHMILLVAEAPTDQVM